MATFAPNYANRYIVRYRAAGKEHDCSFLYGTTPAAPDVGLVTGVSNFFAAIGPKLYTDFAIVRASYREAGGLTTFPATAPTGGTGAGTSNPGDAARFASFTARSTTAQPWTLYLYGVAYDPGDAAATAAQDYRVYEAEDGDIGDAIDELEAITALTSLDGAALVFNRYMNVSYSRYWQNKLRRG
jgi:hypothetical protein